MIRAPMLVTTFVVMVGAAPAAQQDQPKTIPAGYRVETIPTPEGVPFGVGGLSFAADGTLHRCAADRLPLGAPP